MMTAIRRSKLTVYLTSLIAASVVALGFVVVPSARASSCTVTDLPTSGIITSSRLNSRFDQIEACVNGSIGNDNVSATEPLNISKLQTPNHFVSHSVQLPCATKASAWMSSTPANGTLVRAFARCRDCAAADHTIVVKTNTGVRYTFGAIADATLRDSGVLNASVTAGQTVEIDTTQTTAGGCTAYDVTLWFEQPHQI